MVVKIKKILAVALGALTLMAVGSAQSADQQDLTGSSIVETITKRGTLRVGMSIFPPWTMRDKKGDLIGFEIDVAKQVAADMEVEVQFIPTIWVDIIPALLAKKFDVIISGMTVTPIRNLTVNFTVPYAHSGQQMVANKALAGGFEISDFNKPDVTLACQRGATPCKTALKIFPKAKLNRFDDDAQAFQDVVNGNAHAMISSAPTPRFWMTRHPGKLFLPTDENLTMGNEAFALRKGDPDALNFFNNWIMRKISSGWMKERHDFWFTTQKWIDQIPA